MSRVHRHGLPFALLSLAIAEALCIAPAAAQSVPGGFVNATNVSAPTINGNTMTVDVTGGRAYAEWTNFDVGNGFTFNVTNTTTPNNYIFVNRVTGGTASGIDGLVQGNGHVWLINPNGIAVGSTGVFDVGGLLLSTATTLNGETDATHGAAFLSGSGQSFKLGGANNGISINGRLQADIGAIALIANNINVNAGTLAAGTGEVALVGAQGVTIGFDSDLNAVSQLVIETGSSQQNGVQVQAGTFSGARTLISAAGMSDLSGNVVLGNGVANAVRFLDGNVVLYAAGNTDTGTRQVLNNGVAQALTGVTPNAAGISTKGEIDFPGNLSVTAAGGLGVGGTDVALRANGTINVAGGVSGRDVVMQSGGAMTVMGGVDAQDDVVLLGNTLTTDQVRAGQTVDGLAATEVVTAADLMVNASHGGNSVELSAGTGEATIYASPIVPGNYTISGGYFSGPGAFAPIFGGSNSAFTINDNYYGLVIDSNLTAPGALTINAPSGGLTVQGNLTSTNGAVALSAVGDITLLGRIDATSANGAVFLSTQGAISQGGPIQSAINTGLLNASAWNGIGIVGENNQIGSASLSNSGAGGLSIVSNFADYHLTNASTGSGDVHIAGPNGVTLWNASVSTGSGRIAIDTDAMVFGASSINAGGTYGYVDINGTLDGTDGGIAGHAPGSLAIVAGANNTFKKAIGSASPLDSLQVSGTAIFNAGYVRTRNGMHFDIMGFESNVGPSVILDAGTGQFTAQRVITSISDLTIQGGSVQAGELWAANDIGGGDVVVRALSGPGVIDFNGGVAQSFTLQATGNINVLGSLTTDRLTGSAGGTATFAAGNHIQRLGAFTAKGLTLSNVETMVIDGAVSGGSGDARIQVTNGDLQVASTGAVAGRDVELAASNAFVNDTGADAINATRRWLVFSSAPGNNTYDGLNSGNTAVWDNTYETFDRSSVTGNRYVFAMKPTLTFTTTNLSKVYGTDASALASSLFTVSGFQPGIDGVFLADTAANTYTGVPLVTSSGFTARARVLGGGYLVAIDDGSVVAQRGYALAFNAYGHVVVSPKVITGTPTVTTKTYDGSTAGSGAIALNGVVSGDSVGAVATFAFFDENAGTNKTVTITNASLVGQDSGNYILQVPLNALGEIAQKVLTGTVTVETKTPDGTTTAQGTIKLNGVVSGDDVKASATFTFVDPNSGLNKTVTISGVTLSGTDARNYKLTLPATTVGSIFPKITDCTLFVTKIVGGTHLATTASDGALIEAMVDDSMRAITSRPWVGNAAMAEPFAATQDDHAVQWN